VCEEKTRLVILICARRVKNRGSKRIKTKGSKAKGCAKSKPNTLKNSRPNTFKSKVSNDSKHHSLKSKAMKKETSFRPQNTHENMGTQV